MACKTPPYNIESAALKKFRRNAKDGLATWSKWERQMYGAAVEEAVLAKQRSSLLNCPAQVRRERTPEQWQEMYDEAMKEKRA